jgi:ankyrin repeat protein
MCSGNLKVMEFLIANGCRVNSKDVNGSSALHLASKKDAVEAVEFLIAKNADVDALLVVLCKAYSRIAGSTKVIQRHCIWQHRYATV